MRWLVLKVGEGSPGRTDDGGRVQQAAIPMAPTSRLLCGVFALLLLATTPAAMPPLAQRLTAALQPLLDQQAHKFNTSFSLGCAIMMIPRV